MSSHHEADKNLKQVQVVLVHFLDGRHVFELGESAGDLENQKKHEYTDKVGVPGERRFVLRVDRDEGDQGEQVYQELGGQVVPGDQGPRIHEDTLVVEGREAVPEDVEEEQKDQN